MLNHIVHRTLLGLVLSTSAANASDLSLKWNITAGGTPIGHRTLHVSEAGNVDHRVRVLSMRTVLQGKVGPVSLDTLHRVDAVASTAPASFHAVIREGSSHREISAQYSLLGWSIHLIDASGVQNWDADAARIDISTVDLFDPDSHFPLSRYSVVSLFSAETGDVWQGKVTSTGHQSFTIDDQAVGVDGWTWASPAGVHAFWYDAQGVLVKYQTRVAGITVEGILADPPPPGPDTFPVRVRVPHVDVSDLG